MRSLVVAQLVAQEQETNRGIFDLLMRGQRHLDVLLRDEARLPELTQKLLGIGIGGFAAHGAVVGFAAQFLDHARPQAMPAAWMPVAFVLAFTGALCVCLPSFYFYTQLAGLDASFRLVTAQALRAQASTAVMLLGILPFYAAWVLASLVGLYDEPGMVLFVGYGLPFVVGLYGIGELYRAFCSLAEVLPVTHARRGNFLRRLVLCWAAVYSVVAPVALYRLV